MHHFWYDVFIELILGSIKYGIACSISGHIGCVYDMLNSRHRQQLGLNGRCSLTLEHHCHSVAVVAQSEEDQIALRSCSPHENVLIPIRKIYIWQYKGSRNNSKRN